jgi:hypothetical protein
MTRLERQTLNPSDGPISRGYPALLQQSIWITWKRATVSVVLALLLLLLGTVHVASGEQLTTAQCLCSTEHQDRMFTVQLPAGDIAIDLVPCGAPWCAALLQAAV